MLALDDEECASELHQAHRVETEFVDMLPVGFTEGSNGCLVAPAVNMAQRILRVA